MLIGYARVSTTGQKLGQLCKGPKTAIGFHSFGFLIPRFFIQFARLAGEEL